MTSGSRHAAGTGMTRMVEVIDANKSSSYRRRPVSIAQLNWKTQNWQHAEYT
jgi:hypothetical protein